MAIETPVREGVLAPPRQLPRFINPSEVATMLGISRAALYSHCDRGNFPKPVRIGVSLRWREDIVLDWLEKGGTPSDAPLSRSAE